MKHSADSARAIDRVPAPTLDWLLGGDNPAVAVLTRRTLLGRPDDEATTDLWARRNHYPPVAAILDAVYDDGSWHTPGQDYKKYQGSLWQILFLGELWADPSDDRLQRGADYAFSRQMPDGSWSCSNMRPAGCIPCLTANVGRSLARLGFERDERVLAALEYCIHLYEEQGIIDCWQAKGSQLSGYCHMLTPKLLLFLGEVPSELWPTGAEALRDECVAKLRDKRVFRSLPVEAHEFNDLYWSAPSSERDGLRERFLAEHPTLHYKEKAGWLRFGFPLSYNSDALEALLSLAAVGEQPREEYAEAIKVVREAADLQWRWKLRNTLNGKMLADIEIKGQPSKWITLRALQVLQWASQAAEAVES